MPSYEAGQFLAHAMLDTAATLEEHHPTATVIACQITLILNDAGKTKVMTFLKEPA